MIDTNTKIKNRVYKTHDLSNLWKKLRDEGFSVWEAEDYELNEQEPYHLYYIEKDYGVPVEVLFRERTDEEIAEDKELGLTPYKQEILQVKY